MVTNVESGPGTPERPLKVAIVGSGPSGFYAAEALFSSGVAVEVDVLERLPTPYGLVRYGVAPDHAKLKSVTGVFATIARDPRFRLFGHVELGHDIDIEHLGAIYHAVIVATGATADRQLGIEGEHLAGVHAASDFVGWYNGRPDAAELAFDLSRPTAVVVGQGNVALDVCRILARPVHELGRTDIAAHALRALEASRIQEIHLVGRRGPVQAKFTSRELRELSMMEGWQLRVDPSELMLAAACQEELADPAHIHGAKNVALLQACAAAPERAGHRRIHLHFRTAPVALHGAGRLEQVELEAQALQGPAKAQQAIGNGRRRRIEAGLLLRSVGYRGTALAGLPFDPRLGVIPNAQGRILDGEKVRRGAYVTGWIKRGPTGIIGTNRTDSIETVSALLADRTSFDHDRPGRTALAAHLDAAGRRVVSFEHWLCIEREEARRGAMLQKTAEKFTTIAAMLAATETVS